MNMTLKEFLKEVGGSEKDIINYSKEEALEAVRKDGLALQYVKEQTLEVCLEAVKQNGLTLQYVKEQTLEVCLEAVKQNSIALQYVDKGLFKKEVKEVTLEELETLYGCIVKVIK